MHRFRSLPPSPPPASWLRPLALALGLALAVLLGACSTTRPGAPPAAGAPPSHEPSAADSAALLKEQRWLQSWFDGTPVLIAMRGDSVLAIDVPREHCFDAGRSQVKPALAAVLDKVAQSLRRNARSKATLLAAPADASAPAPLALARAAAIHKHLRERGVPAARLGEQTATGAAAVQLRIETVPG